MVAFSLSAAGGCRGSSPATAVVISANAAAVVWLADSTLVRLGAEEEEAE